MAARKSQPTGANGGLAVNKVADVSLTQPQGNRASRRAQKFAHRPRRTPQGGYAVNDVVRARGTSGRGDRAAVSTTDNTQLRAVNDDAEVSE